MKGGWAACPVCKMLVDRNDRERLARRSAKRLVKTHPHLSFKLALQAVRGTHNGFFLHRGPGPAIPTTPNQETDPT